MKTYEEVKPETMNKDPNKDVKPIKKPVKDDYELIWAKSEEAINYLDWYFNEDDGIANKIAAEHYNFIRSIIKNFITFTKIIKKYREFK